VKIVEKTGATINSTRKMVWLGHQRLEFRDTADAVTQRNYKQGQYVGTTAYFYTRDHLGSIREMFTGGGTVVARYDYDPYGRSTTVLGTTPTDFNFTGLYRHSKSNLDLATYRAYDPDLGRWLNRDPLKNAELSQGTNLYAYVTNNPALWNDPTGLERGGSIECDGNNGFRVSRGGYEGTSVSICVRIHEENHVADWIRDHPDACKNKRSGTHPVAPDEWVRRSECKAYKAEAACERQRTNCGAAGERQYAPRVLQDTEEKIGSYCD
jgi:RHS repeat-associated protein